MKGVARTGMTNGTVLHNGCVGMKVPGTNVKGVVYTGMTRWNGAT